MLVLSRKATEQIQIGCSIRVTVLRIDGGTVRLGIEAPGELDVYRKEIYQRHAQDQRLCPRRDVEPPGVAQL
jgi:carbon storage regulator